MKSEKNSLSCWLHIKPYQIKGEFFPGISFCLSTHSDWFAIAHINTVQASSGLPCQVTGAWGNRSRWAIRDSKCVHLHFFSLTRSKLICETFPLGLVGCWKKMTICFSYWHTNCQVHICWAPLLVEGSHPPFLHLCKGTTVTCSQRPFCNSMLWQCNPGMYPYRHWQHTSSFFWETEPDNDIVLSQNDFSCFYNKHHKHCPASLMKHIWFLPKIWYR